MQIYVDMDGVLADFDSGHLNAFGIKAGIHNDIVDWEAVARQKDFYKDLPPMPDAHELWTFLKPFSPIILTGVPPKVPEAADNKRAWVIENFGSDVPVLCCRSSEKCLMAQPGDVLIDDWEKYKSKWVEAGGIWITHVNATQTIIELEMIMNGSKIPQRLMDEARNNIRRLREESDPKYVAELGPIADSLDNLLNLIESKE